MIDDKQIEQWLSTFRTMRPEFKKQYLRNIVMQVRNDAIRDFTHIARLMGSGENPPANKGGNATHERAIYKKFTR